MKNKLKTWWQKHKPSKRRLIQLYAFLLYNANIKGYISGSIYTSNSKYACVPGLNCYSCPGAVGACPLGSLQNSLAESGRRAPYYIVGILLLFGIMLGRTICGFLCPVGLGQELLYKIPTPKAKKNRITRIFSYLKYVVLLVFVVAIPLAYSGSYVSVPAFCKYICPAGTMGGAIALLVNPSNESMLEVLGPLFTWKFCVLVAICMASVFIFRFFCRFLCPLGALYGLFNKFSMLGVKVEKPKCTDCGLCVTHCKMDVRHVGDHECVNCGECIGVCPTQAISWKGPKFALHPNAIATTENATTSDENTQNTADVLQENATDAKNETSQKQKKTLLQQAKRKKTLQIVAWTLALIVLAGALVYYNFIDVETPAPPPKPPVDEVTVGKEVGNKCLEFRATLCNGEGEFTVSGSVGKVTILNYWAISCGPCIVELPYFEQLYNNYPDQLNVVALDDIDSAEAILQLMHNKGWDDFHISFALDVEKSFKQLSLSTVLGRPMTVVLDQNGVIVYNKTGSVTYADLENIVLPLLQQGE